MKSTEHKGFLVLLVLVTIAFFWVLLPFYGAVFWAVILAIVFQPLQRRLELRFGRDSNLAASLSVLVCVVIAVIPMVVILGAMVSQGTKVVQDIQGGQYDTSGIVDQIQGAMPEWLRTHLEQFGIGDIAAIRDRVINALQQLGQIVATHAFTFGQNTLRFIAATGIMLYVLFFMFRDGRRIGMAIRASMPLPDEYTRQLSAKFAAVVRATVKGNLVIAAIQGLIGGVTLWLLDIQAPLLWGALMIFMSLLPAIGAAIVWIPIALYLFLTGEIWKGVILIAVGGGVIGLVDNLLRPTLVGKDTRLPDYVILVSTVGGISVFGINGFVIGPLIAALFVTVWGIYREEKQAEGVPAILLDPNDTGEL